MCGIVGVVLNKFNAATTVDVDMFAEMLICDSVRGDDSTGIFAINDHGNVDFAKVATHPFNLTRSAEYKKVMQDYLRTGRVLIGHNRKATIGNITNNNTHPFVFGPIVLCHNGSIDNFRSLVSNKEREKYKIEVDSHALALLLAREEPAKIIPKLTGAYTLVWYNINTKTLNCIRNDQRPLFFVTVKDRVILASELQMLDWIVARHGVSEKLTVHSLQPGVLLSTEITRDQPLEWCVNKLIEPAPKETPKYPIIAEVGHRRETVIPPANKFEIHYGGDDPVVYDKVKTPFLRIVWTATDYKAVDDKNVKDLWIIWGTALDSQTIEVTTHMSGTEKQIEALCSKPHLISFVKRVKSENPARIQQVAVLGTEEVTLTTTANGMPITAEHWHELKDCEKCRCGHSCMDIEDKDVIWIRHGLEYKAVCSWCQDAEVAEANDANPILPV